MGQMEILDSDEEVLNTALILMGHHALLKFR